MPEDRGKLTSQREVVALDFMNREHNLFVGEITAALRRKAVITYIDDACVRQAINEALAAQPSIIAALQQSPRSGFRPQP